jgi:predicted anti-sigma-YlaC factor YlaD
MLTYEPPTDCPAAREAVSARLDGELSELEAARLDAHLLCCPGCRRFADGAAALARELHAAALEMPRTPVVLARPPRRLALSTWAAAASLLLAVGGSSFALGHALGGRSSPALTAVGPTDVVALRRDSTRQHVLALLNASTRRWQENGSMRAI